MSNTYADWALIGSTGFVGSTLSRHIPFSTSFNSKTIHKIVGQEFDTIICAGAPAVKWAANKDPAADLDNLTTLMDALRKTRARHLVLISTIDVYPRPVNVDEADVPGDHPEAYGRNRRALELFAQAEFERSTIIRLPGLFGDGLKKNIIFDLIHGNQTEKINPESCFQWYPMERFPSDLNKIIKADIRLVNIAPEPVVTADILSALFPHASTGPVSQPAAAYDMCTLHAALLGGAGRYHLSASDVMKHLRSFIAKAAV